MRIITFIFLLCLLFSSSFAQEKSSLELYTEGGIYMPVQSTPTFPTSNGLVVGAGLSYFKPLSDKFSVGIGLGYRFKENGYNALVPDYDRMDPNITYYYGSPYGYSPYGYGYPYGGYGEAPDGSNYEQVPLKREEIRIPQKSIVVPLKLRYFIEKPFFIQTGIETSWLLNYSTVDKRPEFNWILGVGYKKNDFQCSLNYVEGFSDQYMRKNQRPVIYSQEVKNRMLMLNLSYPLWKH